LEAQFPKKLAMELALDAKLAAYEYTQDSLDLFGLDHIGSTTGANKLAVFLPKW
jgi:hypothetical protein